MSQWSHSVLSLLEQDQVTETEMPVLFKANWQRPQHGSGEEFGCYPRELQECSSRLPETDQIHRENCARERALRVSGVSLLSPGLHARRLRAFDPLALQGGAPSVHSAMRGVEFGDVARAGVHHEAH